MRSNYSIIAACIAIAFQSNIASANCSSQIQNKVGDLISVTATLSSGDPNENGEGEPLGVISTGGELAATVSSYAVPTPFLFFAKAPNEIINGIINNFDGDESCSLVTAVNPSQPFTPDQKKKASDLAGRLGVGGAITAIVGGTLCTITTGGVCGAVIIGGAGLGGLGAVGGNIASDPSDPNYTVIATPIISSIPPVLPDASITLAEANAFNVLFANQAATIGIGNAAYISGNRAQGARDAGNAVAESKQIQATQLYAHQLGGLLTKQVTLLSNLHDALISAGFSINATPSDVLNFEIQVANNGLPASVKNALTTFGLNSEQINQVRNLFMVQDINVTAGNIPDTFISPNLISAYQAAADAFNGVSIDVKPRNPKNNINPRSKGMVAVAVLGSDKFDVTTIDVFSTRFGPDAAAPITSRADGEDGDDEIDEDNAGFKDVNGDGIPDLVLHYRIKDSGIKCGDTMVVLTGKTKSGFMFSGADSIHTDDCE